MGGRKPIYWSGAAGTAPIFGDWHPKSCSPPWAGTILGSVDCWLCQTIHQIFGGGPAGYPRFLRVESAWATSSWGTHVVDLLPAATLVKIPLRTVPWGTQWGQLEWSTAATHALLRVQGRRLGGCFFQGTPPLPMVQFRPLRWPARGAPSGALQAYDCYLVDSASSHMLVSKIKPCMSKYKHLYRETANGSFNQLSFIWKYLTTWITVVILELIHAENPDFGRDVFIR